MSVSFVKLSDFSFSTAFLFAVNNGRGTELSPEHFEELDKCTALFDQAPVLYTLTQNITPSQMGVADHVIETMATLARTTNDSYFLKTASALLQALAIKGYPLAQWEYARYLEKQEPHEPDHARLYYSLFMKNEYAPHYMKNQIPAGMCFKPEYLFKEKNTIQTPLEEAWQKSEHMRWWEAAKLPSITGVRSPADFMRGDGYAKALPYVPELMLGTYNLPVTKCVSDQYIRNIYKTPEDKKAFYDTITHYKLPRLSWADRIKVPAVGLLGKLGLAKDFISEGHRMCATADVILALLGKEVYQEKKSVSRPALALDTIKKMADNGFPNAQAFMANYLRRQGLEQGDYTKVSAAFAYANQVLKNPYATKIEAHWAKKLRAPLTQEDLKFMENAPARKVQKTRKQVQQSVQKLATSLRKISVNKARTSAKPQDNQR